MRRKLMTCMAALLLAAGIYMTGKSQTADIAYTVKVDSFISDCPGSHLIKYASILELKGSQASNSVCEVIDARGKIVYGTLFQPITGISQPYSLSLDYYGADHSGVAASDLCTTNPAGATCRGQAIENPLRLVEFTGPRLGTFKFNLSPAGFNHTVYTEMEWHYINKANLIIPTFRGDFKPLNPSIINSWSVELEKNTRYLFFVETDFPSDQSVLTLYKGDGSTVLRSISGSATMTVDIKQDGLYYIEVRGIDNGLRAPSPAGTFTYQKRSKRLILTSMCSANPAQQRRWRVRNPNPFPVSYRYEIYPKLQSGSGLALPGDHFFLSNTVGGPNTCKLWWNQDADSTVKASGGQKCVVPPGSNQKMLEHDSEPGLEAWPNPSAGQVTLRFSAPDQTPFDLEICDLQGRVLIRKPQLAVDQVVQLGAGLSVGIYFARAIQNGKIYSLKLIRME